MPTAPAKLIALQQFHNKETSEIAVVQALLAPLFPMSLIEQEVSQERWIEIPEEVQSIYPTVNGDRDTALSRTPTGESHRYPYKDIFPTWLACYDV